MCTVSALRPGADDSLSARDHAQLLRDALLRSHDLLRVRDPQELLATVLQDTVDLLAATVARFHPTGELGGLFQAGVNPASTVALPALAARMESALVPRVLEQERALLSSHRHLDPDLQPLAEQCAAAGITTRVAPLHAGRQLLGAAAIHWIGHVDPASVERESIVAAYWSGASLALANALERSRLDEQLSSLEVSAFRDRMTGLPNSEALERQLEKHEATWPFSLLVLDFDGLREANTAYGWRDGGDVVIVAVGEALAALSGPDEFPARLHTAGDEFGLLLPGADEQTAQRRRAEVEAALDGLDLPAQFDGIYGGASVGYACRIPGETTGQTLGRAIDEMRKRKKQRKKRKAETR